ncbi:potassium voltage-gated channel subfamily A member 1-like [Mizuhopecten yessoensis]|uniref:Potassium voltage-gated channel subfamily A member 1 n=1 Tax=Mizuhopecten yessoensis TaxID=6573 RepID=A0A210PGX2_MIZYE|nr:potassium voltage-gated channel subfamily A member 1-like [Mizuhopecten yessoensis]OWF35706.1 Potassium voltage-gated channel subfamily A member 1 [Mizuhopecten yessoensis]
MAVPFISNQSRYRRPMSRNRNQDQDADGDLWLFQSPESTKGAGSSRSSDDKELDAELIVCLETCCNGNTSPHTCCLSTCDRFTINVSGQYYELWATLVNRHPTTLLGNPRKRLKYFDKRRNEFFFDRHRPTFESIFNYYMYGGKIRRPEPVPDDIFLRELDFYEIEKEVVDLYKDEEGYIQEKMELPDSKWKRKIWMLMEYPETSPYAYVVAIVSVVITLLSIVLFCVETLPSLSGSDCIDGRPNFMEPFFIMETVCTIWFTLEVVIRLFSCPSKIKYFKDFKNIVDITAIVPYYISLSNLLAPAGCDSASSGASLAFLRVVRLVRIFKLTKHSAGLQVLILTFKASIQGLMLFLVAMVVCVLLFSSAIYYAEHGIPDAQIKSIPDGFWWAVITMCTVGYGDKVPVGPLGKLIGSVCALAGVLTLAIPVPIITENFNKFYAHKTGRSRM